MVMGYERLEVMDLRTRPRWRRVFKMPQAIRAFNRAGVSWWMALKLAWSVAKIKL